MAARDPDDVKAPAGAVGWTARTGFIYESTDLPRRVEEGHFVLTVSTDGYIKGLTAHTGAPLIAMLRVEAAVAELFEALSDVAEHAVTRLSHPTGPES